MIKDPLPNVSFENTTVAFSSKSNLELRKMQFIFSVMNRKTIVNLGTNLIKLGFKLRLPIKGLVKSTIFSQFCGGETIEDCGKTIRVLYRHNVNTILDYSVEGENNESAYDENMAEILATIRESGSNEATPFAVFKVSGVANTQVLTRKQAGEVLNEKEQDLFNKAKSRVFNLCKAAYEADTGIFVDGEESWMQDVVDQMAYEMMAHFNREKAIVYNTYQMYRHDMLKNLKKAHADARHEGYYLGAKLVRGAYMEKERERAAEKGYLSPIQPNKEATDRDFNLALNFCMEQADIFLVSGTHNEYSNRYLTKLMINKRMAPDDKRVYFAQLYGMGDNISFNLANAGYNVAKYVPYGPVKLVLPYLFRRAEENTSVAGQSSREHTLIVREVLRRRLEQKRKDKDAMHTKNSSYEAKDNQVV